MPQRSAVLAHLPGLLRVGVLTAAAFALATLPGFGLLGPLLLSLLLGLAWRTVAKGDAGSDLGSEWAGKWLLRLGIVFLGVRLDARVLLELGPVLLTGSVLGAVVAFMAVEWVGKAARLPVELRRAVAVGTAICGASAIAAALPVLRAKQEHASAAIAAISLVGTLAVLGFVAWDRMEVTPVATMAALAGATLQEVGQVVAAGASMGGGDDTVSQDDAVTGGGTGELALLVKLSRVLLLAPALLLLSGLSPAKGAVGRPRLPPLPAYLLAFLGLATLTTLGGLPTAWIAAFSLSGTVLTTAAMAGIGLAVDLRTLGRVGAQAIGLATVGFLALLAAMTAYYGWWLGATAG